MPLPTTDYRHRRGNAERAWFGRCRWGVDPVVRLGGCRRADFPACAPKPTPPVTSWTRRAGAATWSLTGRCAPFLPTIAGTCSRPSCCRPCPPGGGHPSVDTIVVEGHDHIEPYYLSALSPANSSICCARNRRPASVAARAAARSNAARAASRRPSRRNIVPTRTPMRCLPHRLGAELWSDSGAGFRSDFAPPDAGPRGTGRSGRGRKMTARTVGQAVRARHERRSGPRGDERGIRTVRAEFLGWLLIVGAWASAAGPAYLRQARQRAPAAPTGPWRWKRWTDLPGWLSSLRPIKAACIDVTCSVVCCTSTAELHEGLCAPFRPGCRLVRAGVRLLPRRATSRARLLLQPLDCDNIATDRLLLGWRL